MNTIRQPTVAGLFYPSDADELSQDVNYYLSAFQTESHPPTKALIVPHAGYMYSGTTAGAAYANVSQQSQRIKRVVLVGPSHRVALQGLAVTSCHYFRTPLGDIAVDCQAIQKLQAMPQVQVLESAHEQEHSLEVQLPFLQTVLTTFTLIPIVVGQATNNEIEEVLEYLWGAEETLIVISSDLSHYHAYPTAQAIDRTTCQAIETLNTEQLSDHQACGCGGIKGLLGVAKRRGMHVSTLALCNSGDTAGDHHRVVGYGSWALREH